MTAQRKNSPSLLALLLTTCLLAFPQQQPAPQATHPQGPEKLVYDIEWHLIRAGIAHIDLSRAGTGWQADLKLESAGTVSRLYRVMDSYHVQSDARWCPSVANLDSQEGKKHNVSQLRFDASGHKVGYTAQDLIRNVTTQNNLDTPPCTREILSALMALRSINLEPGRPGTIAITDGKKFANARVEAQARETLMVDGQQYSTMRYEASLFDNVLYKRKGRLFIWISEDASRLPVQLQFQMGFPIGNVLVQLQKSAKS